MPPVNFYPASAPGCNPTRGDRSSYIGSPNLEQQASSTYVVSEKSSDTVSTCKQNASHSQALHDRASACTISSDWPRVTRNCTNSRRLTQWNSGHTSHTSPSKNPLTPPRMLKRLPTPLPNKPNLQNEQESRTQMKCHPRINPRPTEILLRSHLVIVLSEPQTSIPTHAWNRQFEDSSSPEPAAQAQSPPNWWNPRLLEKGAGDPGNATYQEEEEVGEESVAAAAVAGAGAGEATRTHQGEHPLHLLQLQQRLHCSPLSPLLGFSLRFVWCSVSDFRERIQFTTENGQKAGFDAAWDMRRWASNSVSRPKILG